MFELYLFIVTLAIGYYYETSVKESSQKYVQEKELPQIPPKIHKKILKIDKNNPYKLTLETNIEIENIHGIHNGGIIYTETINYLEKPFEEWPEELLDRYINEEEYA